MIRLRLLPNQQCFGCGAIGRADERLGLCLYCAGLYLAVQERKRKLDDTLSRKFCRERFFLTP